MHSAVIAVGDMLETEVENRDGDILGEVVDFMIDTHDGCVVYVILAFSGLIAGSERLYPVPWNMFKVDLKREVLVLDQAQEALVAAPYFETEDWPNLACKRLAKELRSFYGKK